jgi:hypothetical protein
VSSQYGREGEGGGVCLTAPRGRARRQPELLLWGVRGPGLARLCGHLPGAPRRVPPPRPPESGGWRAWAARRG